MQLFRNMNPDEIPWNETDPGYSAFWDKEFEKVKNGVTIDGFTFSGWLYWHINHWKITTDDASDPDNINSEIDTITPELRDNEFIINKALIRAEQERKGLSILGLRQMGKTSFMASYGGRSGVIFRNSQNLIMGTNKDDLNNITQNIDFGLLNCTPYFRMPRISRDWSSERVLLGLKTRVGDNIVHSTFVIRNTGGGKKTEKGAGVSNLKCNLWDEIGKDDFLSALVATKPAMLSANGWRTIPICSGTGGNVEKAQDAKKLFFDPEVHNFLSFTQEDGRVTGLFMPGWLRQDCKYETTLAQYLIDTGEIKSIPKESELWAVRIFVSNKEEAIIKIETELRDLLKAGDMVEYNRWKAYYPLNVDDIFLTESNNKFPIEAIKQWQTWLKEHYEPTYVDLYRDSNGKVQWKYSDLKPIIKFPVKPTDDKNAPLVIFEHPVPNAPRYTYTIGVDLLHHDDSDSSVVSLFCLYVYKRMLSPLDQFKNQVVACIAYRPKELVETHEMALRIAEYYNAVEGVLPEASEQSFFQYFFLKRKGHFLADSFDLQTEIAKRTIKAKKKGLAPTTPNQRHYMTLLVESANEEVMSVNEEGEEEMKFGVTRELDPMLLEEYKNYRGKSGNGVHDGNYDRIVARGCAETLARYYDNIHHISYKIPQKTEELHKTQIIRTPFGNITPSKKDQISFDKPKKLKMPGWMQRLK